MKTVEKVNNLVDFSGKADKRYFDWAEVGKAQGATSEADGSIL